MTLDSSKREKNKLKSKDPYFKAQKKEKKCKGSSWTMLQEFLFEQSFQIIATKQNQKLLLLHTIIYKVNIKIGKV